MLAGQRVLFRSATEWVALAPLRARLVVVTSNKPFSAWGEIFSDEAVAAAMIARLVHTPRSSR